jgi:hypothetical protein
MHTQHNSLAVNTCVGGHARGLLANAPVRDVAALAVHQCADDVAQSSE